MTKVVFVGDVHGRVEAVERALAIKADRHIFVGDFIDSFDRSAHDMSRCFSLVLEAIKKGEAEAIFGNHELSYLMPIHRCSGFSIKNQSMLQEFEIRIRTLFKPHILINENFLVTHAGLTKQIWDKQIWDKEKMTLETLDETLTKWWEEENSPVHQIGRYRGGWHSVGGTFWCDFNAEFEPIPGLTQVFGHTAGKSIRQVENSYCVDCLQGGINFLEMEI